MRPANILAWKSTVLGALMITIPAYFVLTKQLTGAEYIGFLTAGSWLIGADPLGEKPAGENDAPDA